MTSSIGRVGRGTILLDCINQVSQSGRGVTFRGSLHTPRLASGAIPTAAEMTALLAERQRLMGYVEDYDEPVVPIIWDADSTVEGFYRLTSASCDLNQGGLKYGLLDFTVEARQVLGYGAPQFESRIIGAQVPNVDLVVGESWMTYPASSIDQFYRLDCRDVVTRKTADGDLYFQRCGTHYSDTMRYWVVPADWYIGASTIKMANPLEVVVGTQVPRSPYNWELSNGLVRIYPYDTAGRLAVQHADQTTGAWEDEKVYEVTGQEPFDPVYPQKAGRVNSISSVTIERNGPETCVIRLGVGVEMGITWGTAYLDLTLRRGDRVVHGRISSFRTEKWGVRRYAAEASTSISGGLRATANDAAGNRFVLMSASAVTKDTTQGGILATTATLEWGFGIGSEVGGTGATLGDTATALIEEYFSGQSERLVVSAR